MLLVIVLPKSTALGTARTSVGIQLAGTKVRGLIPCGPAALSQRLFVGDEILRVDKAEAGAALCEMRGARRVSSVLCA